MCRKVSKLCAAICEHWHHVPGASLPPALPHSAGCRRCNTELKHQLLQFARLSLFLFSSTVLRLPLGSQHYRPRHQGTLIQVEAALGKVHKIQRDDSSLKCAPKGFDSILAKGRQEPDGKMDAKVKLDKHDVAVPQSKPLPQADSASSSFQQSEYLVYQESQQRLRYVLTFKW